jgi:two-component system nitrogen regulation response regulator GlnG/two-component system response regulator HydG
MRGNTTLSVKSDSLADVMDGTGDVGALVIAWSAEQPWRVGEVAVLLEGRAEVLGRGEGESNEPRVLFSRQRPGLVEAGPPLAGAGLSRRQVLVTASGDGAAVARIGQCEMRVNGAPCDRATLREGDTLYLRRQVLFLFTRRPPLLPKGRHLPRAAWGRFGEPDAHGILGESPATWTLREQLAFTAQSGTHVLITGASGTGKELAARAIHAMSSRSSRPFVPRNAATLPPTLIDAELFGSARNYPNAGMPERPGLIGQADGGTLFLDEVGELPTEPQAHLLRVLDAGGEYQRLGDAAIRRSDFRLIAATNRGASSLKHDLRARLASAVHVSPLSSRREDIPLLARHLVLAAARRSPAVAARFVGGEPGGEAYARLTPGLVDALLRRDYETHTREIEAALWKAMGEATDDELRMPREWLQAQPSSPPQLAPRNESEAPAPGPGRPPTEGEIRAALDAAGGRIADAARALGLSSRFALYRLMRKYGIQGEPPA